MRSELNPVMPTGSQMSKGPMASAPAIDAPRDARQSSPRGVSLGIAAGFAIFAAAALVATLRHQSWDFALIKAMNSVAEHWLPLDRVAQILTVSQLLQGVALVAMLRYLWFATNDVGHPGLDRSGPAGREFVPPSVWPPPGLPSGCSGTNPPIVVLSDGVPAHV
jgi:hypothetical protein